MTYLPQQSAPRADEEELLHHPPFYRSNSANRSASSVLGYQLRPRLWLRLWQSSVRWVKFYKAAPEPFPYGYGFSAYLQNRPHTAIDPQISPTESSIASSSQVEEDRRAQVRREHREVSLSIGASMARRLLKYREDHPDTTLPVDDIVAIWLKPLEDDDESPVPASSGAACVQAEPPSLDYPLVDSTAPKTASADTSHTPPQQSKDHKPVRPEDLLTGHPRLGLRSEILQREPDSEALLVASQTLGPLRYHDLTIENLESRRKRVRELAFEYMLVRDGIEPSAPEESLGDSKPLSLAEVERITHGGKGDPIEIPERFRRWRKESRLEAQKISENLGEAIKAVPIDPDWDAAVAMADAANRQLLQNEAKLLVGEAENLVLRLQQFQATFSEFIKL